MPTGLAVRHPLTGEAVPVWVGNYVLMSYGEGAVMGVPAHDERDFEFAKKYGLPIKPVIEVPGRPYSLDAWAPWYADHGRCINSGPYDGLEFAAAVEAIAADLARLGLGEKQTTWRLRDWGISRQRYWGCPIPVIHCPSCGTVPVPDDDLPVLLPTDLVPDGSGNPLLKNEKFLECPLSPVRRRGAARNRHHGYLRGFVLVFPAVRVQRRRPGHARCTGPLLVARRSIHRRHRARDSSPAVRALLDASGPRDWAPSTSRNLLRTCSRRAWC